MTMANDPTPPIQKRTILLPLPKMPQKGRLQPNATTLQTRPRKTPHINLQKERFQRRSDMPRTEKRPRLVTRTTKDHKCEDCGGTIPKGSRQIRYKSLFTGRRGYYHASPEDCRPHLEAERQRIRQINEQSHQSSNSTPSNKSLFNKPSDKGTGYHRTFLTLATINCLIICAICLILRILLR